MKNKDVTLEHDKSHESLTVEEYRRLKVRLLEIKKRRRKRLWQVFGLISLLVMFIALFFLYEMSYEYSFSNIAVSAIISLAFSSICTVYLSLVFEMSEGTLRRRILEYEAENIKETIEEDIFENSIKMSYKYLDQYYLQTREHAQRGFIVTVGIAIFGGILVSAGIIAMYFCVVTPSYLTCATGVIIEFIASILFYLYNKTVSSMSKYHNKLVLSQNISLALKVSESLPEEKKTTTKEIIVSELLKNINCHLVNDDNNTHA